MHKASAAANDVGATVSTSLMVKDKARADALLLALLNKNPEPTYVRTGKSIIVT